MTDESSAVAEKAAPVFKEPAVPKRKSKVRKARVLDEDSYLDRMGKIIERDFFPDLEKLKAQNAYLDALDKNDVRKLREIHAKYTWGRLPTGGYTSPATFDTPADARPSEDAPLRDPSDTPDTVSIDATNIKNKVSLDEYLASHTSEDNKSFEEIIKESDLRHEQKHAWLYKKEMTNVEALPGKLSVPSIEAQARGEQRPLQLDTWGYKNQNYIMFVPDGVDLTPEEKVEMAKRRQEVVHGNTRLGANPFDENQSKEQIQGLAQTQARNLDGKIGVDGKELVSDTPKVNGYGFVKTPSPAPGVNESPIMTWGEIEGTPFRLDGGDTPLITAPGPSFWIPEPPKRERLALKLADRANERHRDSKKKAMEAAKRRLASPALRDTALHSMSPAARKFASTHLRGTLGTDKALIASYSPATRSPLATPKAHAPRTPSLTPHSSITTDNLLNLPKRPRASDFFD